MVITGLTSNHTFVCGSSQRSLQSSRTPEAQWATSFVSQLVRIDAKSVRWVMGCLKQPLTSTTSQHQPSGYRSISLHLVLAVVCHGLRAFFILGEYKRVITSQLALALLVAQCLLTSSFRRSQTLMLVARGVVGRCAQTIRLDLQSPRVEVQSSDTCLDCTVAHLGDHLLDLACAKSGDSLCQGFRVQGLCQHSAACQGDSDAWLILSGSGFGFRARCILG